MLDLASLLQCIDCKAPVRSETDAWICTSCSRRYPNLDGRPALLPDDSRDRNQLDGNEGQLMAQTYHQSGSRTWMSSLRKIITSEFFPGSAWKKAKQRVLELDSILVVGSGVSIYDRSIHLDLGPFPNVDVVGDATRLPFMDNSFDGLICEVVLEHVYRADKVIAEAFRVLKPGGQCFFIAPFLFPFHGHPSDYRRWSLEGLKAEFARFKILDTGIHGGPSSSMVNLLTEWCYIASGLTYPKGYTAIKGLATLTLFPLKYLDYWLIRLPEAHRLASTLFILAQKDR